MFVISAPISIEQWHRNNCSLVFAPCGFFLLRRFARAGSLVQTARGLPLAREPLGLFQGFSASRI